MLVGMIVVEYDKTGHGFTSQNALADLVALSWPGSPGSVNLCRWYNLNPGEKNAAPKQCRVVAGTAGLA
jgi:hypothetical protein